MKAVMGILRVSGLFRASADCQVHPDRRAPADAIPIYRITVVGRPLQAINYGHRAAPTTIEFRGTVLQLDARGKARVVSRRGAVVIDASFERVPPPTKYGLEYLTYVLWALTPEGRPVNLGELILDPSSKGKLHVSAGLQTFALLVTAEPYYAVSRLLPAEFVVVGFARHAFSDDEFRAHLRRSVLEAGSDSPVSSVNLARLAERAYYVQADFTDQDGYARFAARLAEVGRAHGTGANHLFYLAIAPEYFLAETQRLERAGLLRQTDGQWRRIVVEKPFGRDLRSARELNRGLLRAVGEEQICSD